MKKIGFSLALLALLTACQTKKTDQHPSSQTKASSVQVTSSSTSTSESSEQSSTQSETPATSSTEVSFNGSYYSVQGKYGEVILVNKKYPLAPDYAPGEDPTAKAAFLELLAAMQAQGFAVSDQYSGFRSYETQSGIYQSYVASDGQVAADRYSARPGHSEHQTGLAFDFIDTNGQLLEEPIASDWLAHHAHEYGFIVRYLAGKEDITGYMAETWHVRYIGQEAREIYESGLTLEEYFGVEGGDYAE